MEVRNCPQCGKLFVYAGRNLCLDCIGREELQFEAIKTHLREHPGCTVDALHEATGVPRQLILRFLREGRLVKGDLAEGELRCRRCGRAISSGALCAGCAQRVGEELEDARGQPAAAREGDHASRMHIAQWLKKRDTSARGSEE